MIFMKLLNGAVSRSAAELRFFPQGRKIRPPVKAFRPDLTTATSAPANQGRDDFSVVSFALASLEMASVAVAGTRLFVGRSARATIAGVSPAPAYANPATSELDRAAMNVHFLRSHRVTAPRGSSADAGGPRCSNGGTAQRFRASAGLV